MANDTKRLAKLLSLGLNREQACSVRDWLRVIIFNARRRDTRQIVSTARQMVEDLQESFVLELDAAADPDGQDIVRLCLPTKEHDLLEQAGIATVGDLRACLGNGQLRQINYVGARTVKLCAARLAEFDAHCQRVRDETGVTLIVRDPEVDKQPATVASNST